MLLLPLFLAALFWPRKPFIPLPHLSRARTTLSWLQTPAVSSPHTISLLLLPGGDTWTVPVQTPKLQTQMQGTSTSILCQLQAEVIMHWYKHLPGQPPTRILYARGQSATFDDRGDRKRFQVQTHPKYHYTLTINNLTPRDSGTYYCAYWYYNASQH